MNIEQQFVLFRSYLHDSIKKRFWYVEYVEIKLETAIYDRAGRDKANISGKDHFNKITKNMGNKSFLCDAKLLEY